MKHLYIYFILFSFCTTSCYTLKPDSEYTSSPNYNNQVTVTKPKFVKKNNPIGISIQIATPIIAGAAMYQFAPSVVQYQSGAETKNFQPANAAIGILGMLAINKIVNYAFGYNRVKPMRAYEVDKWMKKANLQEKYNYIAETEGYKIQLIPKTQESDFTVKTAQDVLYYKALFPLASQENIAKVIQSGTTNLVHEDLTTLVHYYPNHEAVNAIKIKYIETARNYTELWDRINKYTEAKVDRELLASDLVNSDRNLLDFISKYQISRYKDKVSVYSFKTKYDIDEKSKILNSYGVFNIGENKILTYAAGSYRGIRGLILENLYNAKVDFSQIKSLKDISKFNSENLWLVKSIHSSVKLDRIWDIGNNQYTNGDDFIYLLRGLKTNNWNLSELEIENYIDSKLRNELSFVSLSNFDTKRSTNEDFERIRKSSYAPFITVSSGVIDYLVYGDVTNRSRFSIPIKLVSSSKLKLYKEGGLATAAKVILSLATNSIVKEIYEPIGTVGNEFLVGYIRPNETKKIAIKYDIPASFEKIYDWAPKGFLFSAQYASKVKLDNHKFDIQFSKDYLSQSVIDKQNAWLDYVYNDLPKTQMMDILRNQIASESQDDRDKEAEEIREEMIRAEEERRRNDAMISNPDPNCYLSNLSFGIDISSEAEDESVFSVYKVGSENDKLSAKPKSKNCSTCDRIEIKGSGDKKGVYIFTYTWNIGTSNIESVTGTINVVNCNSSYYKITCDEKGKKCTVKTHD